MREAEDKDCHYTTRSSEDDPFIFVFHKKTLPDFLNRAKKMVIEDVCFTEMNKKKLQDSKHSMSPGSDEIQLKFLKDCVFMVFKESDKKEGTRYMDGCKDISYLYMRSRACPRHYRAVPQTEN